MTTQTHGRHEEPETTIYSELVAETREMAVVAGIDVRSSRLQTISPGWQLTIHGHRYRGTYLAGETTKLRITSRDPEAELQIIGLTGNDVETFEITMSLGDDDIALAAMRNALQTIIEGLR